MRIAGDQKTLAAIPRSDDDNDDDDVGRVDGAKLPKAEDRLELEPRPKAPDGGARVVVAAAVESVVVTPAAIEEPLALTVPAEVRRIYELFAAAGHGLFVVGGAVRDFLLEKPPADYDLATDAPPAEVRAILTRAAIKVIDKGGRFGVLAAVIEGRSIEIATFRSDSADGDGRRPREVQFGDIAKDAVRRDLTINALYFDLSTQRVIDFVGGLADARAGRARVIGDPAERFKEDGLRIPRFLRFHARLSDSMVLDPEVERAIATRPPAGVSNERVKEELLAGLSSAKSARSYLALWERSRLLARVLPGVSFASIEGDARAPVVVLAALLRDNPPAQVERALRSFRATRDQLLSVKLLQRFATLRPEDALALKRAQAQAAVSDRTLLAFAGAIGMPGDRVQAFLRYRPSVAPDDPRLAGLAGHALGEALCALEAEAFSACLSGSRQP